MVFYSCGIVHFDRLVDSIGDLLRVPRIDNNRSIKTLGSASKLGNDHDTLAGLLTSDILVRYLGMRDVRESGA